MKLIIAGGRDYQFTDMDIAHLDSISAVTEIISGGAKGADAEGERYAKEKGLLLTVIKADWAKHGRGAGPRRNQEMAKSADVVSLFPGGRGTASMYSEAKKAGIQIYDFRNQ